MSRLSLRFLGPFAVTLDDEPITRFESDKVRALLVYLAVEADRPHRRQELAGLLWPDWPERSARTNLRNTLSNLRQAIGDRQAEPPFLLITRESLQFNPAGNAWADVTAFTQLLEHQTTKPTNQQTNQSTNQPTNKLSNDLRRPSSYTGGASSRVSPWPTAPLLRIGRASPGSDSSASY
jgi:DNA-binding SARP family transcriptional activator